VLVPAIASTTANADDSSAQQAAIEIADARDRANAAADALFDAESKLDTLNLDQQGLQAEIDGLQQQIDQLRQNVEAVAINRFTRSGTSSLPLLTGFRDVGEQAQVDVLIDVVNDTSADDFDQFDALVAEVKDKKVALAGVQAETEAARASFEEKRKNALDEVEKLKVVEAQRLKDEAVRQALIAEEATRRQQVEAQAKADATALQAANNAGQPVPAAGSGSSETQTSDASSAARDDGDDSGSNVAIAIATGGSGGGQTGTIGVGGRPGASPGDLAGEGWLCPVQGPVSFGDTWGDPRSGGRTHQGVDMIGSRGLPLIAVVDGFISQKVNELGGNTVTLAGADGNKYYYAHLDSWAAQGAVTAGTIVGYLGDTGNAQASVPHLHFEIHPGGSAAVNPYPTTRAHC
jgi:murein DD-endopeptidase MepM/ murein hydrolase activator NlpD